ncbi:hypothetical protein A9D60_25115 [Leisingera sp. JC1]|nr:hypothetical protein A9D60_25115 [Leisingera sp. JC1]
MSTTRTRVMGSEDRIIKYRNADQGPAADTAFPGAVMCAHPFRSGLEEGVGKHHVHHKDPCHGQRR